jgi:hypothetical protein
VLGTLGRSAEHSGLAFVLKSEALAADGDDSRVMEDAIEHRRSEHDDFLKQSVQTNYLPWLSENSCRRSRVAREPFGHRVAAAKRRSIKHLSLGKPPSLTAIKPRGGGVTGVTATMSF